MNSIGKIIADRRKQLKMSQPQLAEELNRKGFSITYKGISKWERCECEPGFSIALAACLILGIDDIYEACLGNNPHSPLSGLNEEGRKRVLEYSSLLSESGRFSIETAPVIPFSRKLRLFNIPASAGSGEFLDSDDYELTDAGPDIPDEADFGIRISGCSMEPRFTDGQTVWVHRQNSLENGDIGIFFFNGNAYCKKFSSDTYGTYLISLNIKYDPIPVRESDQFKIFGKVVG